MDKYLQDAVRKDGDRGNSAEGLGSTGGLAPSVQSGEQGGRQDGQRAGLRRVPGTCGRLTSLFLNWLAFTSVLGVP